MLSCDNRMSVKKIDKHEVHLWRRRVTSAQLETSCLNKEELEQGERFVFSKDQQRYLTTRLMVREVLSRYAKVEWGDWKFTKNEYGKPAICAPELTVPLFFNVSHTAQVIVLAVARISEIGIDVESRVPKDFHSIAKKFFGSEETAWILKANNEQAAEDRFLTIWTLKEAYMKALGLGFSLPPTQFSILPTENSFDAKLMAVPQVDKTAPPWHFCRLLWSDWPSLAIAIPMECDPQITLQE